MTPRLAWVPELMATINRATGGQIKSMELVPTVDPLKVAVVFHLSESLDGQDWNPFASIAHAFASANDCVIENIRRVGKSLILNVLTKRRFGPEMKRNPLQANKK